MFPSPSASNPSPSTPKNPSFNGRPSGPRPSTTRDSANSGAGNSERRQDTPTESTVTTGKSSKRKKNRHRKRRNRRQSFLGPEESPSVVAPASVPETEGLAPMATDQTKSRAALPFYKLGRDLSSTSLESEALLDHRNQPLMRPRRDSRLAQSFRPGTSLTGYHPGDSNPRFPLSSALRGGDDSDGAEAVDDRTPLIRPASEHKPILPRYGTDSKSSPFSFRQRRKSTDTASSRCSPRAITSPAFPEADREYDINNPPSIPTTPKLGPELGYDDAVVTGTEFGFSLAQSIDNRRDSMHRPHDMVIDMDDGRQGSPPSPHSTQDALRRRRTLAPEEDVCFPVEEASELADEDGPRIPRDERRRRRRREWPDLSVLEEWSRGEKEERTGDFRTKKISEPMLIEGRLRPQYRLWRRDEDDVPYRFTYFNEEFHSTIHAQTISELVQPGGSFRELFIPNPPELEDSSDDEEEEEPENHPVGENAAATNIHNLHAANEGEHMAPTNGNNHENANDRKQVPRASIISEAVSDARTSADVSPARRPPLMPPPKPKRYGPRPTFWLDVLSPTDAEMRVIAKAFGIHALTAEDIMMQEAREKVELFRNYYFVNYRTFEQDVNSENYLQPVNMYVVVFRDGIISFHFSQTPHPANVRRRIRQLMDYLILSSDWISYALIDDITDVFGPLIQSIEDEVDEIDEMIMKMHSTVPGAGSNDKDESSGDESNTVAPGEMLRRVGVCRKKVMGMYRLLSNKADVVKGFAKRCNEQWEVAPKSEIGLYLGDIQDHIMTMTSSLTYYETLLSRAHSNYLAQINILMNERQEQTADVLGKLTVLGTIVLPLNIICGMWGMNVKVPGQDVDSLSWFWSITAGLILFAFASFLIAKRVYKIV
ncbi:putative cora family metal ion transporter [Aspergillus steynii IBT 23096]|uniref:Putative cora family metal ion transporter n=1 Tax=Aspergillus steynii IBT 23096 TaxID=1392250 RepID=A0A2I2G2G7_9EURO|nr:putative cora family metal ion transporter [Aspergillus steynii IBT 23096]PLB47072.1 putative cora family metal ion transporter [Aspergillus steynii IBT 23096]